MSSCGNCLAHKHIIKMLHHQHMLTKDLFPCLVLLRVISSAELAATISYLSTNTIHQSHFMSTTHTHAQGKTTCRFIFSPRYWKNSSIILQAPTYKSNNGQLLTKVSLLLQDCSIIICYGISIYYADHHALVL